MSFFRKDIAAALVFHRVGTAAKAALPTRQGPTFRFPRPNSDEPGRAGTRDGDCRVGKKYPKRLDQASGIAA
jgi:hypothetical protein